MGGIGSGQRGRKTWTSKTLAEHRLRENAEAKRGLTLHWRSLTRKEIQRYYTAARLATLLNAVNRDHASDALFSQPLVS
jgi:hypothetical protein